MKVKIFVLVLLAIAMVTRAQDKADDNQQAVINEDGGKAFIVKTFDLQGSTKFGVMVESNVEQHSIFLGAGWANAELRAREPELSNLLLNVREHFQWEETDPLRVRSRFAPTFSQEKLNVPGNRDIRDLEVQGLLAGMFKDGTLQKPGDGAIYFVFLAPDLHSLLGNLVADKHYHSYHSFFNVSGAHVHYVVIPFAADLGTARETALRSLLVAASHNE